MTMSKGEWEAPLPGEAAKAFKAFCCYRDLGPARSVIKAHENSGGNLRTMHGWSSKYAWVARALAFDARMESIRLEAMEKEQVEIVQRHAKSGKTMIAVGLKYLKEELIDKDDGLKAMDPGQAIRMIVEGAKLERLSSGMSESVQEHRMADADGSPLGAILAALAKMPADQLDSELAAFQAGADAERERIEKGWTKEKLLAEG